MAIQYVEIRDVNREVIGIIDTAQSIIWRTTYKGVGDFEIYVQATPKNFELLAVDNYVTRIDTDDIGIIDKAQVNYSVTKGRMIVASGKFAKSILNRRHIYNLNGKRNIPTILTGNVEQAVRQVVNDNAINCLFDESRNIAELELGALANLPETIVDDNGTATQKQVSYENLLDYTEGVLAEYILAAKVVLSEENKLQYLIYKGIDRSVDNTEGNAPVIFSQDFDNLLESVYEFSKEGEKNTALIGGEGEGLERFYTLYASTETGLKKRETFIDASSISKNYEDENRDERTYTDEEYKKVLNSQGKQTLAELKPIEAFSGAINLTNGQFILNRDFYLGDLVTIQDNAIGKYINARVVEVIEAQDENGYSVSVQYE